MADLKAKIEISVEDRFSGPARKVAAGSKAMQAAPAGSKELAELARNDAAARKPQGLKSRTGKTASAPLPEMSSAFCADDGCIAASCGAVWAYWLFAEVEIPGVLDHLCDPVEEAKA